jgi:hypothetical protein
LLGARDQVTGSLGRAQKLPGGSLHVGISNHPRTVVTSPRYEADRPSTQLHRLCIVDAYTPGGRSRLRDLSCMGRRTRRRATDVAAPKAKTKTRDHQARINVSDEVWREFRDIVGYESIAAYLGRLVERAVERDRARPLREDAISDPQLIDALARPRELHEDLGSIVERLERRLDRTRN